MSATDSILKEYANENDYWVNYINNDIKPINMNVTQNINYKNIENYDRLITINLYDISEKQKQIIQLNEENRKYIEINKENKKKKDSLNEDNELLEEIKQTYISNQKLLKPVIKRFKRFNKNIDYTTETITPLNNTLQTNKTNTNNDIVVINEIEKLNNLTTIKNLVKNNYYSYKNKIYDNYILERVKKIVDNINKIKDDINSIENKQKKIKEVKGINKIFKINSLREEINKLNKNIDKLFSNILNIIRELKDYTKILIKRITEYDNEIMYNNTRKQFNDYTRSIDDKQQLIDLNNYKINDLNHEMLINEQVINSNTESIKKLQNEIYELEKLKIKNIELLNNELKTCNSNVGYINDELIKIKNKYIKCKDNTICNHYIQEILCENNSIFCNDWFTNISNYFNNFTFSNTCKNHVIRNKDVIEDFTNYTVIEGMEYNPNKATDITNNKYYSNILNKTTNIEDISQNIRRNIEIDLFYIEKYNAQINILKYIIFVCCIALFGSILYHNGLLSSDLYTGYLSLVFGIGTFIILYYLFNIFIRKSNRYSEYDYEFIYRPPTIGDPTYNAVELSNLPSDC